LWPLAGKKGREEDKGPLDSSLGRSGKRGKEKGNFESDHTCASHRVMVLGLRGRGRREGKKGGKEKKPLVYSRGFQHRKRERKIGGKPHTDVFAHPLPRAVRKRKGAGGSHSTRGT